MTLIETIQTSAAGEDEAVLAPCGGSLDAARNLRLAAGNDERCEERGSLSTDFENLRRLWLPDEIAAG
jgi:hypothetical protein